MKTKFQHMNSILLLAIVATNIILAQQNELPSNVKMISDIVYAHPSNHVLKLDLFLPKTGNEPFATVVYIHGGGWRSGSRHQFQRYAAQMATFGFAGLTIDYRLSSEAKYPAALEDCRSAILWIRANAKTYNIDSNRIGVVGQSAGGHLATMLGVKMNQTLQIRAIAVFNPVLDLISAAKANPDEAGSAISSFLGTTYENNPILWKEASPLMHITKDSPPMLFLHGTSDKIVPFVQSVAMHNKLKEIGVEAELYSAEGANHLWFFNSNEDFQITLNRIKDFFQKYLLL